MCPTETVADCFTTAVVPNRREEASHDSTQPGTDLMYSVLQHTTWNLFDDGQNQCRTINCAEIQTRLSVMGGSHATH